MNCQPELVEGLGMTMKVCEVFLGADPVPVGIRSGDLIGRLFLADPDYRSLAEQHWSNLVAGAKEPPALHVTPYGQGTQLLVMLEVIAHAR